jgi:hypothetical protein
VDEALLQKESRIILLMVAVAFLSLSRLKLG